MWEKIIVYKSRNSNGCIYGYKNCKLCSEQCGKEKNKYCDLIASTGAFYFEKVVAFKRDLETRRF